MLFLGLIQNPPQAELKPALHRVYRRKQTDRYEVEVDSEGNGGSAHFEYELKMFAERTLDNSTDTKVDVTFMNMRAQYNDVDAPDKKEFGTATYRFPTTGFPPDYSLGGQNSSIVLPILSWYLPTSYVAQGGEFKVDGMRFDGAFVIAGTGKMLSLDQKKAKIKLDLTISNGGTAAGSDTAPHFDSTAIFDVKTGMMESAEGSMDGGGGSITFKLKKI